MSARSLDTGCSKIFLKLDSVNPGGSIMDRVGTSIGAAENTGQTGPVDILVNHNAFDADIQILVNPTRSIFGEQTVEAPSIVLSAQAIMKARSLVATPSSTG